jgi:hypothetical protein
MTIHLDNAFGLPHLDDLMKDEGVLPVAETQVVETMTETQATQLVSGLQKAHAATSNLDAVDHAKAMDTIHDETLDYAQKVMDLGFNIDPARAPRMFEVATGLYKTAIDAKNSKRDAQLKAAQLMINQQKLELDKLQMTGQASEAIETKGVMVEDRNELLKRIRAQARGE